MGFEHMPVDQLSCTIPSEITEEEEVKVFRFNGGPGGNGRFMGIRRKRTLHIIAVDPNGKAYKH